MTATEAGNLSEQQCYDETGALINTITNEYDENGNVVKSQDTNSDGSQESVLTYKYDDNVRVRYIALTVGNALNWYIRTARANTDFLKAFVNLSDCRMKNMFRKCIKADTGTEVEAIKVIKAYMKV